VQVISSGDFISVISIVIGLFFTVCGSYSLFVINTLRSSINLEKTERLRREENDKNDRIREKEELREYRRDIACDMQDMIKCCNELKSRIDKIEVRLLDICKDHEKNHG